MFSSNQQKWKRRDALNFKQPVRPASQHCRGQRPAEVSSNVHQKGVHSHQHKHHNARERVTKLKRPHTVDIGCLNRSNGNTGTPKNSNKRGILTSSSDTRTMKLPEICLTFPPQLPQVRSSVITFGKGFRKNIAASATSSRMGSVFGTDDLFRKLNQKWHKYKNRTYVNPQTFTLL